MLNLCIEKIKERDSSEMRVRAAPKHCKSHPRIESGLATGVSDGYSRVCFFEEFDENFRH
jgi:hypothetical protein